MDPSSRTRDWLPSVLILRGLWHSHKHTQMSGSYSSLNWALSHWVSFAVHRFISVALCVFCVFLFHTALLYMYYCEHGGLDLMGLKRNPYDL